MEEQVAGSGASTVEELVNSRPGAIDRDHARALRVNTLLATVEEIEAELKQARYRGVQRDPILMSVLLLPAGTDLHDFAPVRDGRAVLQSRASCFPACALAPPRGAKLLDACAAPGNKTTQLAAAVGPGGRVLALDKDTRRVQRLRETVDRAGAASIVETRCDDFLTLDPALYADVEAILLDPSCSGTGTEAGRLDAMLRDGGESAEASGLSVAPEEAERIEALAAFQKRALEHALSFPGVQRVSYSTCSIHAEENEMVVQAVEKVARERGFVLARALPSWPRRGLPNLDPSQCCIRIGTESDARIQGAPLWLARSSLLILYDLLGVGNRLSPRQYLCLGPAKFHNPAIPLPTPPTDPVLDASDGFFVAVFERRKLSKSWSQ